MTASVFLGIILAWILWGVASFFVSAPLSLIIAAIAGAAVLIFLRDSIVVSGLMALLEPIGIILPLLIFRQVAGTLGWELPAFSTLELVLFLFAYVVFLATAFGIIPVDAYRWGYAPMPVAAIVLLLCLYGFLSGNWFVPLAAVLAQGLWVAGVGSSNYFDHILHVALVPAVIVVLILRLVSYS